LQGASLVKNNERHSEVLIKFVFCFDKDCPNLINVNTVDLLAVKNPKQLHTVLLLSLSKDINLKGKRLFCFDELCVALSVMNTNFLV
jgi:hypothetical protein